MPPRLKPGFLSPPRHLRAAFRAILPAFCLSAALAGPSTETATDLRWQAPASSGGPDYLQQQAAALEPTRRLVYKRVDARELSLHVFSPSSGRGSRAALVLFHGGGWNIGEPRRMYPFAAWAAQQGMIGISVEYRLLKNDPTMTVFKSAEDAQDALRYVRVHAAQLGIDPARIVASGASAGGHLALCTALLPDLGEAGDDASVSFRPDALILFSAAVDLSPGNEGQKRIGDRWRELSPLHQVLKEAPPILMFHGEADKATTFAAATAFHSKAIAEGRRCEWVTVPGAPHIYMFKDARFYQATVDRMRTFLDDLGFMASPISPNLSPLPK